MLQRMSVSAILVMALALPALAQNTVTLEGSVKSGGAPVAGAQVTVVNAATNQTLKAVTRPNGEFRVLGIFPGQ